MSINFKIVSIEGNIGSGKSTLLENIRNFYDKNTNVIFLREPVNDWEQIKDNEGNSMLKLFYANQEKYSFAFQMMAYISRLKILRDTVDKIVKERNNLVQERIQSMFINYDEQRNYHDYPKYVIITERSLYTDKHIFAKMLYDQGKIEDVCYQIYLNWFDEFAKDYSINYSVYVNTEPQKCYERIHERDREGEEVIPLTYLTECHNYHEKFLDENTGIKTEKLVLDGNVDIYKNEIILEEWLEKINKFINV
jgi:deoxyadenosine/deoxycytidine kinase